MSRARLTCRAGVAEQGLADAATRAVVDANRVRARPKAGKAYLS
jgi:hypothetical protein